MTDESSVQRSRRAFARRIRRRRWLSWRMWLVGFCAVALVGVGVWAVWFSSWLSVDGVTIEGADSLSAAQVERVAAVDLGGPLINVDTDAIAARIRSIPAVQAVEVSKQWPDHVLIDITVRTPVAAVQLGEVTMGLDADGVTFTTATPLPAGLPRVVTPPGTANEALREAARVADALPAATRKLVDHLEVVTADKITLELLDGRVVVWGSADDSAVKAQVLDAMLDQPGVTIDVSVPGNPTTSQTREP